MFAKELEKFGIEKSPVLTLIQKNFDIQEVEKNDRRFYPANGHNDVIRIVCVEKREDIYIHVRDSDKEPTFTIFGHKGKPTDDIALDMAKWNNESEELNLIQKLNGRKSVVTFERY